MIGNVLKERDDCHRRLHVKKRYFPWVGQLHETGVFTFRDEHASRHSLLYLGGFVLLNNIKETHTT